MALKAQPGRSSGRAILNQLEGVNFQCLLPAAVRTGGGPEYYLQIVYACARHIP